MIESNPAVKNGIIVTILTKAGKGHRDSPSIPSKCPCYDLAFKKTLAAYTYLIREQMFHSSKASMPCHLSDGWT
jgi:hypothetical protein